jgi:hypothetical protein
MLVAGLLLLLLLLLGLRSPTLPVSAAVDVAGPWRCCFLGLPPLPRWLLLLLLLLLLLVSLAPLPPVLMLPC